MKKRIIALVMAAVMIFPGFSSTDEVGDFRRTFEGCIEVVVRFVRSTFGVRNYSDYSELCDIPENDNGYIPQGYCYSETEKLHFVSYYHDEKASVISVVDAQNGSRLKTFSLKRADGKDFKGHAGGIAEDGENFYIVDGKKIFRLSMSEMIDADDGSPFVLDKYITTDVKCSYLNSDGVYLYAGEFYTFTADGNYDTDKSHHISISFFETSYARCNAYLISDIEAAFSSENGEVVTPSMIFTTPNCVQGFARMPDDTFALSVSYGRDNNSSLRLYEDVTKGGKAFTVRYGDVSVPAYHLCKSTQTANLRLPPLLEGIDDMNGNISGVFESCAQKYRDAAFIVEKICVFS